MLSFTACGILGAVVYEAFRPKTILLTNKEYVDMALKELKSSGVEVKEFNKFNVDQQGNYIYVELYRSNGEMGGGFGVTFDLHGNFVRSGIIP